MNDNDKDSKKLRLINLDNESVLLKSSSSIFDPETTQLLSDSLLSINASLSASLTSPLRQTQESMARLSDSLVTPAFTGMISDIAERSSFLVASVPPPTHSLLSNHLIDAFGTVNAGLTLANNLKGFSTSLHETIDKTRSSLTLASSMVQSIKDANSVVSSAFAGIDYPFTQLKDSTLNLSTLNSYAPFTPNSGVSLTVESADLLDDSSLFIHSTALSQATYPRVQLTSSAEIRVVAQLERVEGKQDKLTKMVTELIELYKAGKSDYLPAKIKEFVFDAHNSILTIKGVKIFIRPSTKQSALCNRLLNADDITEKVLIDDLIEEVGEWPDSVDIDKYRKQFYQAVRHLNDRICQRTQLQQFIMQSNNSYWINSDYHDLFS